MSHQVSSIKNPAKAAASIVGRLVFIGTTAFGIASYANLNYHKSYWNGTIEQMQTVDFNLLTPTLPTKLSQALIADDAEEIQRTLDSNYGLLGLVVTNCQTSQPVCDQAVQYVSDSNLSGRSLLDSDALSDSTYDVLRDPPPLSPTGHYTDSLDLVRNPTELTNDGRIIGRVYYVRSVPPRFLEAYSQWIKAWPASFLSNSGANRYYSLTTVLFGIGGLSAWSFIELSLAARRRQLVQAQRQQRQQRQLELAQTKLIEEAQDLRQQLQVKLTENSRLIEERGQSLADLKASQQQYQRQQEALRSSFQKSKDRLAEQDRARKKEQQRQTDLQIKIRQQQQAAELLQKEIADLRAQEGDRNSQLVTNLMKEQAAQQKRLGEYAIELEQVWQELLLQTAQKEDQAELVELLRQQSKQQRASASFKQQETQKLLQQAKREKAKDKQRIGALEENLKNEKRQANQLRTLVNDISDKSLNFFERRIMSTLKDTARVKSAAWSVHAQLDVSSKGHNAASKLTDCIVIGNSFVAIIEAKHYAGKIYTEGDTRNSVWLSSEGQEHSKELVSCWGDNPYKQVSTYVQSAMGLFRENFSKGMSFLKRNTDREVSFYGIIVFPDDADLSSLDTDLGELYKIIHLKDLVNLLHSLERQTQQFHASKGRKGMSSADIEKCLYGGGTSKSSRKSVA